ncbi:MAG TPA: right-handed parallel beta-helix repeat-containing protein [Pyrinomonadaceae bacterium]
MNKFRFTLRLVAILACVACGASAAHAQQLRSWVSGVGDDGNPCTRTAPCKTFATAQSNTFTDGEINVLDPGGFGTVTIIKSLTIDGTGTFTSILAPSFSTAINVNLTDLSGNDPLRTVRLRGISLNGNGQNGNAGTRAATRGINISSSNPGIVLVFIEDCVIDGFTNEGLLFNSNGGRMNVRNTTIRNNGTAGIKIDSSGSNLNRATIEHSTVTLSGNGIHVEDNGRVSITDVVLSHNTNGLNVTNATASTQVNIFHSMIAENTANGIISAGPVTFSTVNVSECMIADNSTGLAPSGNGRIFSSLNNTLASNAVDGAFTLPNNTLK